MIFQRYHEQMEENLMYDKSFEQIERYHIQIVEGLVNDAKSMSKKQVESYFLLPILLHPKSKGTVKLQSTDPFDPPLIDPQYLTHSEDVKTFLRGNFHFMYIQ